MTTLSTLLEVRDATSRNSTEVVLVIRWNPALNAPQLSSDVRCLFSGQKTKNMAQFKPGMKVLALGCKTSSQRFCFYGILEEAPVRATRTEQELTQFLSSKAVAKRAGKETTKFTVRVLWEPNFRLSDNAVFWTKYQVRQAPFTTEGKNCFLGPPPAPVAPLAVVPPTATVTN